MDGSLELKEYAGRVAGNLMKTDFDILARIAELILNTKKTGARIYTAGNGGSHATASHISNDLVKGCRVLGREGFRCVCLGDLSAQLTCLANDFSYGEAYEIMLKTFAEPGDLFIVFSGSGNSENIVRAVRYAKNAAIKVIGFGGRDGGKMAGYCDELILAPSDCMEEIEDLHLIYEHDIVSLLVKELPDEFDIEIINPIGNSSFKSALFDFDGTISLIREGWQGIMIPYFTDELKKTPNSENAEECAAEFIHRLTGKQTIFQCMYLAEEISRRGGVPLKPIEYKNEYLRRLTLHIKGRCEALEKGADPTGYMVKGSLEILKKLKEKDIKLYLASGTDETDVRNEARLLGIDTFFDGGIFGAKDDDTDCSKELVIRRMLDNKLKASELVAFGDGFVEIELTKNAGGYPVAVATDERRGFGIDTKKRERLIEAGAAAVMPNFENAEKICKLLRI